MKKVLFPVVLSLLVSFSASAKIANNTHENAVVSLSFVENSMSYANQAAIDGHIKAGQLQKGEINGIAKPFSQMDQHEKAAVALSFTENSHASSIQHSIKQHLSKSKTYSTYSE